MYELGGHLFFSISLGIYTFNGLKKFIARILTIYSIMNSWIEFAYPSKNYFCCPPYHLLNYLKKKYFLRIIFDSIENLTKITKLNCRPFSILGKQKIMAINKNLHGFFYQTASSAFTITRHFCFYH